MAALGPVLILISIPLVLGWVPRNRVYGFRVAATMNDDAIWKDVNARSGRHALLLGAAMIVLELIVPPPYRIQVLSAVAGVGLAIIVVVNWRYANRLTRRAG